MRPSDAKQTPCGCGGRKAANKSVCLACWKSAPAELRTQAQNAPTIQDQRAAYRQLIAHAKTRNAQPGLF